MNSQLSSINHNMISSFSNRQIKTTNKELKKSYEKLSSGYNINRAADDAAGLAISEKMRRLVRGLNKGSDNILEGISLIQTAEGALNEVHDILQRMNELTIKGLTETIDHDDRRYVQNEIDHLYHEINRIGEITKYNELHVLKGNRLATHKLDEVQHEVVRTNLTQSAEPMPSEYVSFDKGSLTLGGATGAIQKASGEFGYKTVDSKGNLIIGPDATTATDKIDIKYDAWNTDLTENFGTKLDFSAMAALSGKVTNDDGSEGASKIYEALYKFIGSGFYSTCCTCNQQYSVVFIDSNGNYVFRDDNGYNSDGTYNSNYGGTIYVDISSLLEEAKSADSESDSQILTAKFIKLIESSAGNNSKVKSHFSRFASSDTDPYSLFVYDYRDYTTDTDDPRYGYLIPPDTSRGTGQLGDVTGKFNIYNTEVKVDITTYQAYDPLFIQHGDDSPNRSPINLPDLAEIFEIYKKYGYESIEKSLTLEEYIPETITYTPGTYTTTTKTIPPYSYQKEIIKTGESHTEVWYEYGERHERHWKDPDIVTGYETVDVPEQTVTITEYHQGDAIVHPPSYGPLNYPMISVIKDLISQVSEMRTQLGVTQNELEHAYNYNELYKENLAASESEIRDTEMATEMVSAATSNIISQAAESMLAQSNILAEGVLRLIK